MKKGSIYIIKNKINNKVYICQTTMNVRDRFLCHMKDSTCKNKDGRKFYDDILRLGKENFYYEILEENIPQHELNDKEIEYIKKFNSYVDGYNSTKGGDGRLINFIDGESDILKLAKNGVSANEIANMYNVDKVTIYRTLHKIGFYYYDKDEDLILELYNSGNSIHKIAERLNISDATIERVLHKNNIYVRKPYINTRDDFNYNSLIVDYNNQTPIKEICKKYNISETSFYRIKSKLNLKTRDQIYKYKTVKH